MDDLISRQIAQKLFGKALTYKEQQGKLTWTTCEVKQWVADFIEDLPSAQPEIIRCKDCKQFRRWIDTDICFCDITESERSDNDFCSRAERRKDEGD